MVLDKKENKAELQKSIVKSRGKECGKFDRGKFMYGKGDWRVASCQSTPSDCKVARRFRFWAKSLIFIDILDYKTNVNRYGIFFSNITIIYVSIELKV